ncbi:MAG: hypothetical protein RIB03_01940 [Henriciella sp.]|uniref:hypothetical protein n=1 Tax=Henriciella sp. TaxID=1968823 RepID=UPI0032ECD602
MLFLLNDRIVEVAVPEMHLECRWKTIGCGRPHALRAHDVVDFVHARLDQARLFNRILTDMEARDLAALIISRTGANSLILRQRSDGSRAPMLRRLPAAVLDVFAQGAANDEASAPRRSGDRIIAAH